MKCRTEFLFDFWSYIILILVVVVTFFNKTLTIAKQHWHISIKEHITGLGAITCKKIINLR